MGRPKLIKSETEVIAQRTKWANSHNKRRRDNYARDSHYRSVVNDRNRNNYREKNGVVMRDCRENLNRLSEFGMTRHVAIDGMVYERLTFTTKELAQLMGDYHPIVLYRWHKEGKFPRPNVTLVDDNYVIKPDSLVYTDDQAVKLLTVLGAHQAVKQYLHSTDTDTIRQLFSVME